MVITMRDPYLMHGGDYNPEQWLAMPEILEQDIDRFLEAGINTVTLGVFSWAKLEPKEGIYDFDWLAERIDKLYEKGISVILATPSGARPHWLAERYPQVLRVDERGKRQLFGGRHNHCLTSPVYREKVGRIDRKLAERFGAHPAVKLWHISNELGGDCHCGLCQAAFRDWLRERYQTIENLNDRWCTTFWSHTYDSFDQVEAPSAIGESSLMALNLDWKRFVTDQTISFVEQEIRAIHEGGSDKPATVNMMYRFEGLDYGKLAGAVDLVSWDSYPLWHKESEWDTARDTAFWHDVMRGLKKKPFLLMESCPSSTNWQSVSKLKKPGMLEASSLQSIAHGSQGVLYFQMRQSRGASEKFHGAVIDHYGGSDTRTFREVCGVGRMLGKLGELAGCTTGSRAAILYDWDNLWAMKNAQGPRNKGLHYEECVDKSYRALRRLGLNVDIIDQSAALEGYRFAAAPMQYLFHPGFAKKIRSFVETGGTFVMTYWSGVVDENDRCFLGGRPADLTDVFGLRALEIDGLYDEEENAALTLEPEAGRPGWLSFMKERYACKYLCELVSPLGARPLMVYGKDFYAGEPALLRNSCGKGLAYYICADMEQKFYDDLYENLIAEAGITSGWNLEIPEGVEICSRENEDFVYWFVQNYNRYEVKVQLPQGDVIFGDKKGELRPFGSVILRVKKTL